MALQLQNFADSLAKPLNISKYIEGHSAFCCDLFRGSQEVFPINSIEFSSQLNSCIFKAPHCGLCVARIFGAPSKVWFKDERTDKNIAFISLKSSVSVRGNCKVKILQISPEEQIQQREGWGKTQTIVKLLSLGPIRQRVIHWATEQHFCKLRWAPRGCRRLWEAGSPRSWCRENNCRSSLLFDTLDFPTN